MPRRANYIKPVHYSSTIRILRTLSNRSTMMQRNAWLTLTLGAILFFAHPAHAQLVGDRMRIETENGEKFTGQLKGYNPDSLILLTNSTELSIAYTDMARLQRSLGGRARYKNRALIGLGAGMVAGLIAARDVTGAANQFTTVAGVGLLGGMGGLVNATIRQEQWERLDIPDEGSISVTPEIGAQPPDIPAQDSISVTPVIVAPPPDLSALENRLRITTENGEKLIGPLKGYNADSLTILTGFTEQSIAYADMARLQRSLGIRSYFKDGAGIGLTVGAGGSIAVAVILRDPWAGLIGIGYVTPMLVLGGAISGAAVRKERWKHLDIPGQNAASFLLDIGADPAGGFALENRLRITTENGEKLIGPLKGHNADSLTILANSAEQSIAYADIARLQKSLGIRSQYEKGALIGFSAGMASGLSALDTKLALGLGGVAGLTGAIVGARIRRERWKRLDIPDQDIASVRAGIDDYPDNRSALEIRMRITTENGEKLIGRQKGYDAYFLTILTDSTEISIAYADMARLQRSLGVRSHFIKGTLIGLVSGMFWGAYAASNIEQTTEAGVAEAFAAIGTFLLGTGGGTLVGALVGASIRTERWERVDIPGQSAASGMSITPTIGVHPGGSLALGARISF